MHKLDQSFCSIGNDGVKVLRKELLRVSEERRNRAMTDPAELWRQWFETGTRMWSGALGAGQGNRMDPYGLYRQWFNSLEDFQELLFDGGFRSPAAALRDVSGPTLAVDPSAAAQNPAAAAQPAVDAVKGQVVEAQNLWKQWFEATQDSWQKAAGLGQEAVELVPRWAAMWDQIRNNLLSAEGYPTDPLQFATRWYSATRCWTPPATFCRATRASIRSSGATPRSTSRASRSQCAATLPASPGSWWRWRTRSTGSRRPLRTSSTVTPSPPPPSRLGT